MNERTEEKRNSGRWYISHGVPVSVLVALAIQTGVAIWWAAGIDNRVLTLEGQLQDARDTSVRLTRFETKQDNMIEDLKAIKAWLFSRQTRNNSSTPQLQ